MRTRLPAVIAGVADLRFCKVNQGFLDMTGFTKEAVLGRSVYEIDVLEGAQDREGAIERLNDWRTIRQTEANLRLPSGEVKPVVVAGQPIELGEVPCMLFTFMDLEPRRRGGDVAAAERGAVCEGVSAGTRADDADDA